MSDIQLKKILEAAQIGETTDWEFKSAKGGFPGSFWDTYSAMANTEGGFIILGVSSKENKLFFDGLNRSQVQQYKKILFDGAHNKGIVSLDLLTNDLVSEIELGDGWLLAVRIPRASRNQRPVYRRQNPFGGNTFRRNHEGDYACSDDEVRRMLADADPVPADQRILLRFSLADIDVPSLKQYRQRFLAAKGDHPWLSLEDKDLLEKLGAWRKDRQTGNEGLTLAGILMFGKEQAIRDPEAAPQFFVDYREKLDPSTRWSDRIYPDGTWEANLFQFYQRVWPKLSASLPVPFRLEGGMRRDETPVHEALREALVNALIHADYAAPGGVVVERYPDRFILENPGTLLVSFEQFRSGGVSECRNKSLQQMFMMIGGGERAGSGVDKIRAGWKSQHWRAPQISIQRQPDRVRLFLPMVSLIPEETLAHLRELFGDAINQLTSAEKQALATAHIEGNVSNSRLQEFLTNHPVDISRMLQRLCDQKFLASDNRGRWTTYRLKEKEQTLFTNSQEIQDSQHLGRDSQHSGKDSQHSGRESLPEPPKDIRIDNLQKIAEPIANRKKVTADEMQQAISELCQKRFLSTKELAQLLKRDSGGLQQRFIGPMVKKGLLRLRYPEAPNRPDQAYIKSGT